MIEDYKFGLITVNNKEYNFDVEVWGDGKVFKWWRKTSHIFSFEDIKHALKKNPEVVVFGTGFSAKAKVDDFLKLQLQKKEILFIIDDTQTAIQSFNTFLKKIKNKKKIVGFFHLTC